MIQIYTEKNENENTFKLNNIVKHNGGMHDLFDTDKYELYIVILSNLCSVLIVRLVVASPV